VKKPTQANVLNLKAARRNRLYEEIIAQIQNLINSGNLKSGDQLPPERELAEIFKVSRNSVREAIRALEEKSILQSRPGDGTYVVIPEEKSLIEPLADAIQKQKDKLQEIFQFRRLIEPQIAYLAAESASDEDIVKFRGILEEQERQIRAGENAIEPDVQFHLSLAKSVKNSLLMRVVEILNDALRESRAEYVQSKTRQELSLSAHFKVLEAIEKRDPRLAWKEMNEHLVNTERVVFGH